MVCKTTQEKSSPSGMGVQWVGKLSDSVEAELVGTAMTAAIRLIEKQEIMIIIFF